MNTTIRRIMLAGAWGSVAVALLGVLGYLPGLGLLASAGTGYIPMAPSTAAGFILLGGILLLPETKRRRHLPWCIGAAWTVALFGLLDVAGHFTGMDLNFEDLLVPEAGRLGSIPVARMSPATGVLFFIAGWVLAGQLQRSGKKQDPAQTLWLGVLNLLLLLSAFVFFLAYLYGSPLMYGLGSTIPMALTTSLGFLFLAVALGAAAPDIRPLCGLCEVSTRGYLLRHILPLAVVSALFGSMVLLLSHHIDAADPVLLSALVTILAGFLAAAVAARIAQKLGTRIERSESDLKRANDTLRQKARKQKELEFIVDHSPVVAFLWRAAEGWPVEYVSESIRQFGYTPEDFYSGRVPYSTIVHPDDLERVGSEVAACSEEGKTAFSQEYRILSPEGEVFTIDDRTWIRRDDGGEITHYQGIVIDITRRKRAEAALEASERRFKTIFENADDGILLADTESKKFITANPRICRMLGYSEEELTALSVTDIHPEKDLPFVLEQFEKQAKREIELAADLPVRRRDGSVFYADVNSFPLELDGKTYLAGFFRDVTERRKAETILHRFREVIDHSLDAIFLLDKNGWFIDVNEEACRSLGYSRDELLEMEVLDIAPDRPEETPLAKLIPMIMATGSARFESRHIRKDGSEFPVEVSVGVEQGDHENVMIAVARDITDRKKMEAELLLQEEMMIAQSRQAAMGDMIAMIAHQWRQPITVVAMAVNNLRLRVELEEPMSRDELLKVADTVTRQTKHLSKTIDDFRDFFKPNKEKESTTMKEILEATLTIIGKSLENNEITLEVTDNSTAALNTYPNELIQVFLNLLGNAKDILKGRGEGRITLTVDETDDTVSATICDNGGGIPKAIIHHIGEPYFTTKEETGTGLGIYMSKTIVERHLNGTLTWHNTEAGACFTISLKKE